MRQSEIETGRLWLRPCTPADLEALYHLWTEPAVRRYFWDGEIISRPEAERAIRASLSAFSEFGVGQWVIHLREGGQFIGSAGLLTAADPFFDRELLPADQDLVELIFALLPAYRRRGYATEAVQALLDFAFNTAGLSRVVALADAPNIGSIRVLEKAGMPRAASQIFEGQEVLFFDKRVR